MLILNKELPFYDETILKEFHDDMMSKPYDDESRFAHQGIVDYITELYRADEKLTEMVQDRIGDDVVPIVSLDLSPTADWDKLDFFLTSFDEDRKVLKREELLFYEFCDRCFGVLPGFRVFVNNVLSDNGFWGRKNETFIYRLGLI